MTISWTGVEGMTYEIQRRIGNTVQVIARVVGIVRPIIDQLLGGAGLADVLYTINAVDQKGSSATARVRISPGKDVADTTQDDGLNSLPRGRGKIPSQ